MRVTLIYVNLFCLLIVLITYLTGPYWGLVLDYEKGELGFLLELCFPVFAAQISLVFTYLASGVEVRLPKGERKSLLQVLVAGGTAIFIIGFVVSTAVFQYSNTNTALAQRLSFEQYTSIIALLLAVFASTVTSASIMLFATSPGGGK